MWSITQFWLIYLPSLPQRRFIEGLQIPIAILATIGISFFYQSKNFQKILVCFQNKFVASIVFLSFLFSSNLIVFFIDLIFYTSKSPLSYISQRKIEALEWLKKTSKGEKIVLASYFSGALIPPFAQTFSFIAHGGSDTLYFLEKKEKVEFFFQTNDYDFEKIQFLKENKIDYIFFSEIEKRMGNFNPYEKQYLKKVFENEEVTIFQVNL